MPSLPAVSSTWTTPRPILERMEQKEATCGLCGMIPFAPGLSGGTSVIVCSPAMQGLLKTAARFALSDAPIALFGETGTGKEVIARLIHANSERRHGPFVAVNVATLPSELLESELFGHGKGAFTGATSKRRGLFEEAHQGTLFLDEIGEMPLALQAKLLRVLQDGEIRRVGESHAFSVDVRVFCATHRDLEQRVRAGTFREDLYYRIKVLRLEIPALRDRREDILPLARHFLAQERTLAVKFSAEAEDTLRNHVWTGNVRELQNAVRHGAALSTSSEVGKDDLPSEIGAARSNVSPSNASQSKRARLRLAAGEIALKPLREIERDHILEALRACHGSPTQAALILGIGRNTLWRKLQKLN